MTFIYFCFLFLLQINFSFENLHKNNTGKINCITFPENLLIQSENCDSCCGTCKNVYCCSKNEVTEIDTDTCTRL